MNQQPHHSKHGRCRIPAILVGVLLASLSMMTPSAVQAKDRRTDDELTEIALPPDTVKGRCFIYRR